MNNIKKIKLRDGGVLEISCTDELLSKIKNYYKLPESVDLLDSQISDYVIEACRSAVQKAEIDTRTEKETV